MISSVKLSQLSKEKAVENLITDTKLIISLMLEKSDYRIVVTVTQ